MPAEDLKREIGEQAKNEYFAPSATVRNAIDEKKKAQDFFKGSRHHIKGFQHYPMGGRMAGARALRQARARRRRTVLVMADSSTVTRGPTPRAS